MKNYVEKLKKHTKKYITKTELEKLFATSSDEELFEVVTCLVAQQVLEAVKTSKTNGNRSYPIYLKYRVLIEQESFEAEINEIATLHPLLLNTGYLQTKPAEYKQYRPLIQKLDRYLFYRNVNEIPVSRKERSFEIFDEEKVLDAKPFCTLLERLGINADTLYFYDTPEYCFNDYIPEKKDQMTLLICENKDIWFNIRRMLYENHATRIFDTNIDGVVYGCGNKISGNRALTHYTQFIGAKVKYLYWGDIDRAGLDIYLNVTDANPDICVELFIPAYEEMLRLAQNKNIPDSDDGRIHNNDFSRIYNMVSEDLKTQFEQSIQNNKRIPQEIITYAFLKENMR